MSHPNTYYYHEGYYYTYNASGGYVGEEGAPALRYDMKELFEKFDLTDSVQVLYDVKTLNEKIGLIKDASNINILDTSYNDASGNFPVDEINISADEFVNGMQVNQVISVGRLNTLYDEFDDFVKQYFNGPNSSATGFATLFSDTSDYVINNGVFDASSLLHIITEKPLDSSGSYVSDLSGVITINRVNELLKTSCSLNVFGNRDPSDNPVIEEGFLSGDLIFIPNGLRIMLNAYIDTENFNPLNSLVGLANVRALLQDHDYISPEQLFSSITNATTTRISRQTNVPLLIRLANLPYETVDSYTEPSNNIITTDPYNWVNRGFQHGNKDWTAVALSSNGQYQTALEYNGGIYRSDDYGINWTNVSPDDYGTSAWSSVSLSDTGQYQSAVAYNTKVFISEDYGLTWVSKGDTLEWSSIDINSTSEYQTAVTTNGFIYRSGDYGVTWTTPIPEIGRKDWRSVSVSFTGQYQTALSFNDAIYVSGDYGVNWTKIYALTVTWSSVSLSSTGQYQTACVDNGGVYLSSNYGNNWTLKSDLGEQLWSSVAISGTGQYQTLLSRYDSIYMSTDYGATWETSTNDINYKHWSSVAISFGGNYQTSVVWDGSIYLSKLF
jgi:photosystem II stability/assembly factor-like uncharacterized protein